MSSDMMQGLVLGPMLFVIYMDYLIENVIGMVNKFGDDTKTGSKVEKASKITTRS